MHRHPMYRRDKAIHRWLPECGAYIVLIMTQALAGLVVARPRSHIHLACARGEGVLRLGTHVGGGGTRCTESRSKVRQPSVRTCLQT